MGTLASGITRHNKIISDDFKNRRQNASLSVKFSKNNLGATLQFAVPFLW